MITISLVDVNKNELLVQLQACMKYVFQKEYLVSRNSKYGSCVSHFHLQSWVKSGTFPWHPLTCDSCDWKDLNGCNNYSIRQFKAFSVINEVKLWVLRNTHRKCVSAVGNWIKIGTVEDKSSNSNCCNYQIRPVIAMGCLGKKLCVGKWSGKSKLFPVMLAWIQKIMKVRGRNSFTYNGLSSHNTWAALGNLFGHCFLSLCGSWASRQQGTGIKLWISNHEPTVIGQKEWMWQWNYPNLITAVVGAKKWHKVAPHQPLL